MRRAALVVALFASFASTAASSPNRSAAKQPAGADRQDRHDPAGARHPLSGHDAADGRRDRRDARDLPRPPARAGSGRGRFRHALSRSGCRAGTARANANQERSPASGASANGRELEWVRDNLDVYAFHIAVPARRQVDRHRLSICLADGQAIRGASWPRLTWRASSGSSNSHVSRRLFRSRRSRCRLR